VAGAKDFGPYYDRRKRLRAFEAAWARNPEQEPGWPQTEIDRRFQALLNEWLRSHQAMLIGELVPETLKYLRNNPGSAERRRYEQVLVDEYQDLNRAEQRLLDMLSEQGALTVIGDEDQSIYEHFRYAHPEGIARFNETHQDTADIPLEECRRCPTRVVKMASELISHNRRRVGHTFAPRAGNPAGEVHIVQWPSPETEATGITRLLQQKVAAGEAEPGQILILCPRRQLGYTLRDTLRRHGLPTRTFFHEEALDGNPRRAGRYQAQEAFSLFTLVANPEDQVALRGWLGFGHPTLRSKAYRHLRDHCASRGRSPRQALQAILTGDLTVPHTASLVRRYQLLLERLEALAGKSDQALFEAIFPPGEAWAQPFRAIAATGLEDWTPPQLLRRLRTNISQPELPSQVDYIRIMSLHKSKGLTADHVIVTGFIEGILPARPLDLPFEESMRYHEEQRRLFYVAITRPQKTLLLSTVLRLPRSLARQLGLPGLAGKTRKNVDTVASTFLAELGPDSPAPVYGPDWFP
jgi:superfamily I DNA/RNA helicase